MKNLYASAMVVLALAVAVPGAAAAEGAVARPDNAIESTGAIPDPAARRSARISETFRQADRNRNNLLSRREYFDWYRVSARKRGPLTWKLHAARRFKRLDLSGNGQLSQDEFASDPYFARVRPGW
jgi:hypothetical protein